MSNIQTGTFDFEENIFEKTVYFPDSFINPPVMKVTSINKNINVYLSDVQNNYFVINKSDNDFLQVNYVAIESDG